MIAGGNLIAITGGKHRRKFKSLPDDPGEIPIYSLSEVARSLQMSGDTLTDWTRPRKAYGRRRENFAPMIEVDHSGDALFSFNNVIEAHMLIGARRTHKVSTLNLRRAMEWTRQQMPSRHPLIDYKFQTNGKHLFVSRLIENQIMELRESGLAENEPLYNASLLGQGEMIEIVDLFLTRIERESGLAVRLYPIKPKTNVAFRPVMMDMALASGQFVRLGIERTGGECGQHATSAFARDPPGASTSFRGV